MEKIAIGILAHVDAGKTTLSEALLYESGSIKNLGRVDKGDAFLDTDEQERSRGITIFSKQAVLPMGDKQITLLDTPGHVDFSAEMERTLQVLDYAALVISGSDGVQGHTKTLWGLLERYGIPTFIFINKMDQPGTDREALMKELDGKLSDACADFSKAGSSDFYEKIALAEEDILENYLQSGTVSDEEIRNLIRRRKVFPCFFGSALKLEGVREFMEGLSGFMTQPRYNDAFGAQVYKISRDSQGNRLTHLKITGGFMKIKMLLPGTGEKVNQIRIYSGDKYQTAEEACAGTICAVPGLMSTVSGMGVGEQGVTLPPALKPVLTYRMELPDGTDARNFYRQLTVLAEEDPMLHIVWNEELQEIQAELMGEVQLEVIRNLICERFTTDIEFGPGNIVYKETIRNKVEGVGHFEPLRHYAEVHVILEPGTPGSGLTFASNLSEDVLDGNWQRLILKHLEEKEHRGVLTGSAVTDIRLTLTAGRAHTKHTEGGDFRQATYRAVRHGLMQAESVLLEPFYEFRLEVPGDMIGRAMTDIERMQGSFELPSTDKDTAVLCGSVPAVCVQGYQSELAAYSRGQGRLSCTFKGYEPCHNTEEVIAKIGYDADRDTDNPAGSVFCSHGAGFNVPWDQVQDYMQIPSSLAAPGKEDKEQQNTENINIREEEWIGTEEIDAILARTFQANTKDKNTSRRKYQMKKEKITVTSNRPSVSAQREQGKEYLLVDGYNVIFAWEELKELAEADIDGARGRLLDSLCGYQAVKGCKLIVVFDAYRVQRHPVELTEYHNIYVVFTAEAETADQYIEKFAHAHKNIDKVTVATSDYMEQIITRGQGCTLLSARELKTELQETNDRIRREYAQQQPGVRNYLFDQAEIKNGGVLYGTAGITSEDD